MDIEDAIKLTHKGILALARAERQGIRIDMGLAKKNKKELSLLIDKLYNEFSRTKFYRHWEKSRGRSKLNVNSNPQLQDFLYRVKKITPIKLTKKSKKGATDEETLEALRIPELDILLRMRKLKKLRDTYLNAFLTEAVEEYIHPVFNLHIVVSYRSSSNNPNFQTIPVRDDEARKIVRSCIFARPGNQLLELDYKGLEVNIAACYHKDPTMIKYIKNPKSDMHADMATQIFLLDKIDKKGKTFKKLRYAAKNGFVFPQFYGDYYGNNAGSLSREAKLPIKGIYKDDDGLKLADGEYLGGHLKRNGIKSLNGFKNHLKEIEYTFWNDRFPVYADWKKKWWRAYQKKGYFDMLTGFRCSGVMGRNDVTNYPVQGSAFHCLLWSFIKLDNIIRRERLNTRLIGQIHDSILFDVHPSELDYILKIARQVTCKDLLEAWDWIIVPLSVDAELCEVDQSWYYKKEIDLSVIS